MGITISNYTDHDAESVWQLHLHTVNHNDGFVKNLLFPTDMHDIPNIYKAFFVMRDEGKIIGMVGLRHIDDQTLEIKRLQVHSTFQGRGLGRRLMNHALEYAHAQNYHCLKLDVSVPQIKAQKLYESLGFVVTHTADRVLGPDREKVTSIYMERNAIITCS
ncbi:MAG: GNAT family N-acetyltransferase [Alphaproteobacteria bacterium]|nr:GNAT family N-acetyltransferase [Alphaproteobacteria bacterium]